MGLGVLFCGYLLRIINFIRPEYSNLFAFVAVGFAMFRLRPYNTYFRYAFYLSVPMTLFGAFQFADAFFGLRIKITSVLGTGDLTASTQTPVIDMFVNYTDMLLWLAFNVLMCRAIYELAKEVGLLRICRRAALVIFMCVFYYLLGFMLDGLSFVPFVAGISPYFQYPLFFFRLIWQAYCAIMIYSAYAKVDFTGGESDGE